jgi:beta-glucosidase
MMNSPSGNLSRRQIVKGAAALAGVAAISRPAMGAASAKPFHWGVSTSAYQVEGNNVNTDIWLLEQVPGGFFKEPSGDTCDHYHRFREDIALFAKLGFNSYRFSVEWARVEPVKGQFSFAELDHYAAMAQACRDNGIVPCITLHHFSSPLWLARQGGWETPETAELFARYAGKVAEQLGQLAGAYFTINEINLPPELARYRQLPAMAGMAHIQEAIQKASGMPNFSTMLTGDPAKTGPIFIRAHELAVQSIRAASPSVPVGMTLAIRNHQAIAGGEEKLREIQATDYDPYFALAKNDDFVAIQCYSRVRVGPSGELPPPDGAERTQTDWEFYPDALEESIRYVAGHTGKPIWVTENGIATEDDTRRVAYIRAAMQGLQRCLDDRISIGGYFHWSAFDNFEWNSGYRPHFGLIAVDRKTFVRTPKPSADYLGKLTLKFKA